MCNHSVRVNLPSSLQAHDMQKDYRKHAGQKYIQYAILTPHQR